MCACSHDWDSYSPDRFPKDDGSAEADVASDATSKSDGALIAPTVTCPTDLVPPKLVGIPSDNGGYCIDATEVTKGQYQAFLDTKPALADQVKECTGNASLVPIGNWPPKKDGGPDESDLPVVYVNWCDANAYCLWAGKRLCGALGGGDYSLDQTSDVQKSEWYNACSYGETRVFPYGDDYQKSACNGRESTESDAGPVSVGSLAACVGPVEGLYDLSGNVFEWDGACIIDPTVPKNSSCAYRGGGYTSRDDQLSCKPAANLGIFQSLPTIGFRCCADTNATIPSDAGSGDAGDGGIKDASKDG